MQKTFKKQLLVQNVQMDGSINYMVNGDINIQPCPWEDEKQVTSGERVRYEAGIEVDSDGRTRVKRWNRGLRGPMYETIFETAHAAVKITRENSKHHPNRGRVKIDFSFPKKYPLELMKQLYEEESDQVMSYFKTRKEECLWNQQQ